MAKIMPFKGFRYHTDKIKDIAHVVCPPYDIISPEAQERYYQLHDHNMIRVELGKDLPEDTPSNNRYTRAAAYLADWQRQGFLIQNQVPSLYLYMMSYLHPQEGPKTLKGFLTLVQLEDPETSRILPHEWTFPKAKHDRLQLLRACHANTSPVFSLYSDPDNQVMARLEKSVNGAKPHNSFVGEDEIQHRLWIVSDPGVQRAVAEQLKDQPLFIADGHHRYETALNFRNEMRVGSPDSPKPYDRVLMFLTGMNDPGISLMPIHRVILNPLPCDVRTLQERLRKTFEIIPLPFTERNEPEIRRQLFQEMRRSGSTKTVFGMYSQGEQGYQLLILKEDARPASAPSRPGRPVDRLDVAIFQRCVLQEALGMEDVAAKKEGLIQFIKDEDAAIRAVRSGTAGAAFFLNATRVDQVREVVMSGDRMPQKSTYFYPKPLTGLVLNIF